MHYEGCTSQMLEPHSQKVLGVPPQAPSSRCWVWIKWWLAWKHGCSFWLSIENCQVALFKSFSNLKSRSESKSPNKALRVSSCWRFRFVVSLLLSHADVHTSVAHCRQCQCCSTQPLPVAAGQLNCRPSLKGPIAVPFAIKVNSAASHQPQHKVLLLSCSEVWPFPLLVSAFLPWASYMKPLILSVAGPNINYFSTTCFFFTLVSSVYSIAK